MLSEVGEGKSALPCMCAAGCGRFVASKLPLFKVNLELTGQSKTSGVQSSEIRVWLGLHGSIMDKEEHVNLSNSQAFQLWRKGLGDSENLDLTVRLNYI